MTGAISIPNTIILTQNTAHVKQKNLTPNAKQPTLQLHKTLEVSHGRK